MSEPNAIQAQLAKLVSLQEIDLKIDQIKKEKSTVPEPLQKIDLRIRKIDLEIKNRTQGPQGKDEVEKRHRQTLAAMELNEDRAKRATLRLDNVANSKEFQAATKEMDQLKKLNEELAVEKEKTGEELKALEEQFAEFEKEKSKLQEERKTIAGDFDEKTQKLQVSLTELSGEREKAASDIRPDLLRRYDRVRVKREGMGVVPAVSGQCKGCNYVVAPQVINRLHRPEEFETCPTCHRFLYLPTPAGDSSGEEKKAAGL